MMLTTVAAGIVDDGNVVDVDADVDVVVEVVGEISVVDVFGIAVVDGVG